MEFSCPRVLGVRVVFVLLVVEFEKNTRRVNYLERLGVSRDIHQQQVKVYSFDSETQSPFGEFHDHEASSFSGLKLRINGLHGVPGVRSG